MKHNLFMVAFILHPKGAFVKTVRLFCTGGKPAAHTVCKRKQIVYARTLRRKVKTKAFLGEGKYAEKVVCSTCAGKEFFKSRKLPQKGSQSAGEISIWY